MIFGIDFGTTYTLISYYKNNKIKFIKFKYNKFLKTDSIINNSFKLYIENNSHNLELRKEIQFKLFKFFNYLKKQIQKKFKKNNIFDSVITIPVRFNDFSRNLIKQSAFKAGFNVLKLIYEPVAATISSINNLNNGNYLTYDVGGGTFDLTLLKKHEDVFQVIKVDGLNNFGGNDIDSLIAKELNISILKAKKLKEKNNLNSTILKKIYNLFIKTFILTENLIQNHEIVNLILTGGSSKFKFIQEYFKKFKIIQQDEQTSVVKGALICAKNIVDNQNILIDVVPFNLGIEILNGDLDILIYENYPVPFKITKEFESVSNNTVINIIQEMQENRISLGKIVLNNLGIFFITFYIDCDGVLLVKIFNQKINETILFNNLNNFI